MRTISAATAAVLLADHADLREQLRGCGRAVGGRVEVDLDAVEAVSPQACRALEAYHCQTLALWRDLASGTPSGAPYMTTQRLLADHQQVTGKVGRRDLPEVLAELEELALTAELVTAVTAPEVDGPAVRRLAAGAGGSAAQPSAGVWVVQVPMSGPVAWPEALGGPVHLSEIGRTLRLTARHASWRDRRVRRLARVEVLVEELWADTHAARQLLAATA